MEGAQVRRRLVQSTLFPHKESSIKVGENCNGNRDEELVVEEEEDGSGSRKKRRQSKRKPNPKSKTTPPASSKKVTENGKRTSSNQVEDSNAPVIVQSGLFVKPSEGQQQDQPIVIEALEENNEIRSPPDSIANCKSTPRKLKRQDNSTPTKRRNTTPSKKMKNGTRELCKQITFDLAVDEQHLQPIPDLRLEAKLTAEENSRIFAGRQIHPFFTSRKGGKTNQDLTDSESKWPSFERKEKGITFNPIHVIENVEDDHSILNWEKWIFSERSAPGALECGHTPVYEGSVGSLNFDNLLGVSYSARTSTNITSDQCSAPQIEASMSLLDQSQRSRSFSHLQLTDKGVIYSEQQLDSVMLPTDTEDLPDKSVDLVLQDHKLGTSDCFAGSYSGENLVSELQTELHQERIMSHYHACNSQPDNGLWTDKYQPRSAKQICGNSQSVKFLSEWLHLWHQKGSLASRSCIDEDKSIKQDNDHDYQQSDSDTDTIDDKQSLKNVLLVSGPVGIGKSAAVYACARDEGFQVIEINASDWRNGALIKQKFGEAVESHWLQRTVEKATDSDNKALTKFFKAVESEKHCSDNEAIELIHLSDKEDSEDACALPKTTVTWENSNANYQHDIKTLILFEDVDVALDEDHGFISSVQQLAETAKRPIILTSSSVNPVLPKNLDRSELSFSVPSLEELLGLVNTICAAEKTKIHPSLLERFVDYCQGDIRKTIMLLQFWCQGQNLRRANELHRTYGPVLFDVEAAYEVLPKVIRFGFPSQLSEAVDKEVLKSLMLMEEINCTVDKTKSEDPRTENIHEQDGEPESVRAKKEAMLDLNCPLQDEFEYARFDTKSGLSDSSCSPVAFSRRRRKINAVLSSDSEDESPGGTATLVSAEILGIDSEVLDMNRLPISHNLSTAICHCPTGQMYHSEDLRLDESCCLLSERIDYSHADDTIQSHALSFVPESSFVPETDIIDEKELYSTTVSYGNIFHEIGTQEHCSIPNLETAVGVECNNSFCMLPDYEEMLGNNYDTNTSSFYQEEVGDSLVKSEADVAKGYTMLDECSRVDFMRRLTSFDNPEANHAIDYVQETWRRLHDQSKDLRKYVTAEEKTARQVLDFTHGTSKIISEADLLLKDCQTLLFDYLGPTMIPSEKTHSYSYFDNQLEMSSVLAQHGMCFYAKEIASLGSFTGLELASEMLTSSASSIALGKLVRQHQSTVDKSDTITPKSSNLLTKKQDSSSVCYILQSVVPLRSHLAVKGAAFHEYLSTLSQISRFESTRLSECIEKRKQRRGRVARHYLSSGSLAMSSEDISLLGEYNCFQSSVSS